MKISKHAKIRSQQRGIPENFIDLILAHGSHTRKPGNAFEYRVNPKDKNRIISILKHLIHEVEKLPQKAVLVSNDGEVITVYHLKKNKV